MQFAVIGVMAVDLTDALSVGAKLHVKGHTTDLTITVASMQVEHEAVAQADSGASVGIKVGEKVRPGDEVYRVI